MAYLVNDAELLRAVRAEVDPAISQGLLGLEGRLEECPRLVAVYHEVLRCHTASASVRSVAAPTDLGDVTLDAGAKVLLPYRQLHFDASVFGPHVEEFRADRFLPTQISAKARVSVLSVAARPIAQGVMWQGENCLRLQRSWFIVTISMLLLCTLEWRKQGSLDVT